MSSILFLIGSWVEFQFMTKALQKLYGVKTKKESEFRESKSEKYAKKKEKSMKRLRNDADREKADKTYIAKLNTMDSLWLFIREFFGCLPDDGSE